MGLFDLFSKKKGEPPKTSDRELARLERLVANKLSQNIDRQEAIDHLCRMASRESAAALLKRFDWALDPSITDQEEKETCLRGIVAAGDQALEPVRSYCRKAESLMWPLRVLKRVVPEEQLADELLLLLDQHDTEYVRNVEPKVQLITELAQHRTEEVREALEPFVADASERVRFTAATSLFEVGSDKSVPALIAALPGEESQRIKNRILQRLAELDWEVPEELRVTLKSTLSPSYRLEAGRVRPNG